MTTLRFHIWVAVTTDGRGFVLNGGTSSCSGTSLEQAQREAREVMGLADGTYQIHLVVADVSVPRLITCTVEAKS